MPAWGTCAGTSQHLEHPAAAAAARDMQAPRHRAARSPSAVCFSFPTGNSVVCFLEFLKISYRQFNYTTTWAFTITLWPLPELNQLLFYGGRKGTKFLCKCKSPKPVQGLLYCVNTTHLPRQRALQDMPTRYAQSSKFQSIQPRIPQLHLRGRQTILLHYSCQHSHASCYLTLKFCQKA